MTIPFTGAGGLFTRIGHMGGTLNYINASRDQSFIDHLDLIRADYPTTDQEITDQLYQQGDSWTTGQDAFTAFLSQMAQATIIAMVQNDTSLENLSLQASMAELIRQMQVNSASVSKPTASATISYGNGVYSNVGTGKAVSSIINGYGVQKDYILPELIRVVCTSDAQTGGATAGQEVFQYTAERAVSPETFWTWPVGSGATGTINCVSAAQAQDTSTNLLNNSGFEDFTANAPDNWVIVAGVAGTTIDDGGSAEALTGSNCIAFIGNGVVLHNITQAFNTVGQTTATLTPQIPYTLSFWDKVSNNAATGVFAVRLIDGAGATISDDASTANTVSVTVDSETTSYAQHSAVFRLPRDIPSTVKLSIIFTTVLSNGHTLYLDELTFSPALELYTGGPTLTITRGGTDWIQGDTINDTIANDFGSDDFQGNFQRLFDMRSLGLQLPSSGSNTINDNLIV